MDTSATTLFSLPLAIDVVPESSPDSALLKIFDDELGSVVRTLSLNQPVYRSLKDVSAMIGGEYGKRVIYELLQNAHDAQPQGNGQVLISLIVNSPEDGFLLVANGGTGFTPKNLYAIRNIASSTKEVGEGIGNKGVGFRSVSALSEDPRIYSCRGEGSPREAFDGYCFRFASAKEVEERVAFLDHAESAEAVASSMPRFLGAVPIGEQPEMIKALAREGYASVISLSLVSADAITQASKQLKEIADTQAPVLLFLDRIAKLEIRTSGVGDMSPKLVMTRKSVSLKADLADSTSTQLQSVTLGPDRNRWLVARRNLDLSKVLDAVQRSIPTDSHIKTWLNWQGEPVVSCAVPMDGDGLNQGRLYNFLPMSVDSKAPLKGHLDAPFYTSINRERARLDLPLNAYLLDMAAQVCAETALAIRSNAEVHPRCAVDFAAWNASEFVRLRAGFEAVGTSITKAQVWPTSAGKWQAFGHVFSWPLGLFKIFTASRAARAGATDVISGKLSTDRIAAIDALARQFASTCTPSSLIKANWAEKIAEFLPPSAKDDRWGKLYVDLVEAFPAGELSSLIGKKILLDRKETLVPAGKDVYVRHESGKRRKADSAPLPPSELARRLTILADGISVRDSAAPFEKASLWQSYDATDILGNLPTMFTERQADSRREAAFNWAFEVWRHDATGASRALSTADLHVPTRSGWIPATRAAFSQSWTDAGAELDYFLAEAGAHCEDSAQAANALILDIESLPEGAGGTKTEWVRFLTAAGVSDGLVPIASKVPEGPMPGWQWSHQLKNGYFSDLDSNWYSAAQVVHPSHPNTYYWRSGEAWKFPGQSILAQLSDEARLRFAALALRHLQVHAMGYSVFRLWRRDRDTEYQKNTVSSYTPLATCLIASPWFPVEATGKLEFVPIAQAWLMTERHLQPKFVPQAPEEVTSLLKKDDALVRLLAGSPFHLKVWKQRESAAHRLQSLAEVCETVTQPERSVLKRQYEVAWKDLLELDLKLVSGGDLVSERPSGFAKLVGSAPPTPVYIRDSGTAELARLLIDTGASVLAAQFEVLPPTIRAKIDATRSFAALRVEDASVRILVDGETFDPEQQSMLLIEAVPWLVEALQVGHHFSADGFEARISMPLTLERLRRLRVREVAALELVSPDGAIQAKPRFLHRDESRPTLLMAGSLDSRQLVESIRALSNYLHPNLHSFESLIVRLGYYTRNNEELGEISPTESVYAAAAQVPLDSVHDYLTTLRHDDTGRASALLPLLAYFMGAEAAQEMGNRLLATGISKWPTIIAEALPANEVQSLISALNESFDLSTLMDLLGLDYERLNRANMSLGHPSMVSESDLRRQFEVFKNEMRPSLLNRLRRHFLPLFGQPMPFAQYPKLRSLDFIAYNVAWSASRQSIKRDDVLAVAQAALEALGISDSTQALPSLESLQTSNRKAVIKVVEKAKILFEALGIKSKLDDLWTRGPSEVAAALDLKGLLDFHPVTEPDVLKLFERAGLWPDEVPVSLELADHGLSEDDLDRERKRVLQEQAEERRRKNLVKLGDIEFDTTDPQFAGKFAEQLSHELSTGGWATRSKKGLTQLVEQSPSEGSRSTGGGGGQSRPFSRPNEFVRGAIGLAGELLAFEYLKDKHPRHFNEFCWVSENRTSLFSDPGSMKWGFDFKVQTTERDWLYEVKATPGDLCEFELTDGEYREAVKASPDRRSRFRILFVFFALDPSRCRIVELPNPVSDDGKLFFRIKGKSSTRMAFEIEQSSKR